MVLYKIVWCRIVREFENYFDMYEISKLIVPIAFICIGWFVVSAQNDKRERRKEIRSLIDEVKDLCEDLRNEVLVYYSYENKKYSCAESRNIKLKFLLISEYVILLKSAGLLIDPTDEVIALRKLCIGGNFETRKFKDRVDKEGQFYAEVDAAFSELMMLFDKRYFSQFSVRV